MNTNRVTIIDSGTDIGAAAELSLRSHRSLLAALPFLPARSADDFARRIEWACRNGVVAGLREGRRLAAFLGAFPIPEFRNAGRGAFGPDWCHGFDLGSDPAAATRELYRELASRLIASGCRIHAFGFYAPEAEALEAMHLSGFGRIVMDAARSTGELCAEVEAAATGVPVRRAGVEDAAELARLDGMLADHIAASPVLMPNPRGRSEAEWKEWLERPAAVALLAARDGETAGFIKAEDAQFDVTYAVHDRTTLAINGMLVAPTFRREGVGSALLAALARFAVDAGKEIVSVDCETTNPEAHAFWLRWFRPVTWSLERRV